MSGIDKDRERLNLSNKSLPAVFEGILIRAIQLLEFLESYVESDLIDDID